MSGLGATVRPSMSKASRSLSPELALRPGEGVEIPTADRRQVVGVDGTASVVFSFRLADAPAPDRRYLADAYSLTPAIEGCRFLFAQEKIGRGLRSLVVVHMSGESLQRFVDSTPGLPLPDEHFSSPKQDAPIIVDVEPDQTVAFRANLVAVAVSNGETCMDFYQLSPFAMHAVQNGGRLQVSALVRVELRTGQFFALLKEIKKAGYKPQPEGVGYERV